MHGALLLCPPFGCGLAYRKATRIDTLRAVPCRALSCCQCNLASSLSLGTQIVPIKVVLPSLLMQQNEPQEHYTHRCLAALPTVVVFFPRNSFVRVRQGNVQSVISYTQDGSTGHGCFLSHLRVKLFTQILTIILIC